MGRKLRVFTPAIRQAICARLGLRLLADSPICTATQQPPVGGSWFGVVHGNLPLKMAHAAQRTPCSAAGAPAQWLAAAQRSQKAGTSRRKTIPEPPQADQLLPLSECPQRCGLRGVCGRRVNAFVFAAPASDVSSAVAAFARAEQSARARRHDGRGRPAVRDGHAARPGRGGRRTAARRARRRAFDGSDAGRARAGSYEGGRDG